ncbi:hypothetical protein SLE2022_259990 [Rubroshorea leprosula]
MLSTPGWLRHPQGRHHTPEPARERPSRCPASPATGLWPSTTVTNHYRRQKLSKREQRGNAHRRERKQKPQAIDV